MIERVRHLDASSDFIFISRDTSRDFDLCGAADLLIVEHPRPESVHAHVRRESVVGQGVAWEDGAVLCHQPFEQGEVLHVLVVGRQATCFSQKRVSQIGRCCHEGEVDGMFLR